MTCTSLATRRRDAMRGSTAILDVGPELKRSKRTPGTTLPDAEVELHVGPEACCDVVARGEERVDLLRRGVVRDEAVPGLRGLDAEHAPVDGVELRVERAVPGGGQDVLELEKGREDREPDPRTVENGRSRSSTLAEQADGARCDIASIRVEG